MGTTVPENLQSGELISYPKSWVFNLPRESVIYVSDQQLRDLSDPDKVVDLSISADSERAESLRQICERAQARGAHTLIIAFDHFWAQYREGQDGRPRELMPDSDEFIELMGKISAFAQGYDLGLELSVLSPLEIGPAYTEETGETGKSMHFRRGVRDPNSGAFSVQLWQQRYWVNNKGPLSIRDAGVRVFAFKEERVPDSPYLVVKPEDIIDITDTAQVEIWEDAIPYRQLADWESDGLPSGVRIRVHGQGTLEEEQKDYDRVLVVQKYHVPEMDYFSENALPYLTNLVDRYVDAGVVFNALYSDEMHIQQDWGYFSHHDNGQFAQRYVSPGFAQQFAERYGEEYEDFAKYLVYFVHGQEDSTNDVWAKADMMHVWGDTPEAIQETALFRSRYYQLLQNGVVDLFVEAKEYLESKMGYRLTSRAHSTWAESPTIDFWRSGPEEHYAQKYEYTSNFVWSNTVQQAASACYDYFKWGEFLLSTGTDHPETGWLDRNYYGIAIAASLGMVNEFENAYCGFWGMPAVLRSRLSALVDASGAMARTQHAIVQERQHRTTDVLMLYPLDLVAADERFGSWMTQYAYANYLTQEKLVEMGEVCDGAVEIGPYRFDTLVALFEPFPSRDLLAMMQQLLEEGGQVIWSGPPPILYRDGGDALNDWQLIFGVEYEAPGLHWGVMGPGRRVEFEGVLVDIESMTILTDFTVDKTYPVTPKDDVEVLGRVKRYVVATRNGNATYLGFRPRDDQSESLGYHARWWHDIFTSLGAHAGTDSFDQNDDPNYISRYGDYFYCAFPNGAISMAPHIRLVEEQWHGGFHRDAEEDAAALTDVDIPSDDIRLDEVQIHGHTVSYEGNVLMSFRINDVGQLEAFAGQRSNAITVDGVTHQFADEPINYAAWAPVQEDRKIEDGAVFMMYFQGQGDVRVPVVGFSDNISVYAEGATAGSRGEEVPHRLQDEHLHITLDNNSNGRWLYVVEN